MKRTKPEPTIRLTERETKLILHALADAFHLADAISKGNAWPMSFEKAVQILWPKFKTLQDNRKRKKRKVKP